MKKNWLLIVVIILAIIVGALLIYAIFFHQSSPQATSVPINANPFADSVETNTANLAVSPATFSINFYKWYMGNVDANSNFPTTEQLANSFTQWMTPNFILQYQTTVNDPNTDADPILFSQDDPSNWGSGITAKILTQTDTTSSVQVVIGSGSLAHTFTVQLVKSNGQWLIDSVAGTY